MGRLLVTAFGPFGRFKENPSQVLAREVLGNGVVVLPVSFAAADKFASRPRAGVDRVLMLGVAGRSNKLRVERIARNVISSKPDVEGVAYGPDMIDPDAPDAVAGLLFEGWNHATQSWKPSRNAGGFLCNYLYFRVATRWPDVRSGFVHVPPFSKVPLSKQVVYLERILARIQKEST